MATGSHSLRTREIFARLPVDDARQPQLRRAEANKFLEELEWLLLREATQESDEGDLVGKAKPVMRVPAPAELYEIFFG